MRRLILVLALWAAGTAQAIDVCSVYAGVHEREIANRIRSGIPFKLLSIASDGQNTYKRIVHIEFDLWTELLTIEILGRSREASNLKEASNKICRSLSFSEAASGRKYRYQLFLNPLLGEGLKRLKASRQTDSGLVQVNWDRLARDLETEKVLINKEFEP